jgi:general secretion pathway protein F
MTRFRFVGLTAQGVSLDGELSASNERSALAELERRGLTVVELQAVALAPVAVVSGRRQPTADDLVLAFRGLSTLLTAGVGLAEAVDAQARALPHPAMRAAFDAIGGALRQGQVFSEALKATDLPVPAYVPVMVLSGERAGLLASAIGDAAEQMAYDVVVRREIRQALTYPAVLVAAGLAAVVVMFAFVVPKFANLLERGHDLPWLAWAVLSSGALVRDGGWWIALAVAAGLVALAKVFSSPRARGQLLDQIERLPVLGRWRIEAQTAAWARVLSTLLANRVPLLDAMALAQTAVDSERRRARLAEVRRSVKGGGALADALEEQAVVPLAGCSLVRVGERSGELPAMLRSLAALCEDAGRSRMKQFLALLEPIAILAIGSVVGVIMIGIILAITSANDLVV